MTMTDWYADANFMVHVDIKIHTGGVLTMVKGATQENSMNQKIKNKSPTEVELASTNDVL